MAEKDCGGVKSLIHISNFLPYCSLIRMYSLAEVDEFIAKLWQVHLAVKKEGYTQV